MAAMPASEIRSRWSAETAPTSAASSAPPQELSWSACSFGTRPASLSRQQDPSPFRDAKRRLLHEDVAESRRPFGGDGRDHFVDDEIEICRAACAVLHRYGVGAEEGGDDAGRPDEPSDR